jgi:1-aminocyclopropane-1-carboxylate synthase
MMSISSVLSQLRIMNCLEVHWAGIKIQALLICNLHNPLGMCHSKENLEALYRFCKKRRKKERKNIVFHLISDEIYVLSVFEVEGSKRTPFTSILSLDSGALVKTQE